MLAFGTIRPLEIRDLPSLNHDSRPGGAVVDTVVLHATVFETLKETAARFADPDSRVSAHYTIDRDGLIARHVEESRRAWHAGESRMRDGRASVNDFSIGIELVNRNDGADPYPAAQVGSLRRLLSDLRSRHPIRHAVSHAEIAIPHGRKTDPAGLDFSAL
ncbi:MAG: N-acetylmuramoyl-L-alanine amidase [Armatimonadetes bacterium]|nr:N-acetylmuramoyl-L-alanine amidase [Armatimonadota bacterium]